MGRRRRGDSGPRSVSQRRKTVEIKGKKYELCQLRIRDYAQLQEAALDHYKDNAISTFTSSNAIPREWFREEMERLRDLTIGELPKKKAPISAGGSTKTVELDYEQWWASTTLDGVMYSLWLSMRQGQGQEQMKLDDVHDLLDGEEAMIHELGDQLGDLSRSTVGNQQAPETDRGSTTQEPSA